MAASLDEFALAQLFTISDVETIGNAIRRLGDEGREKVQAGLDYACELEIAADGQTALELARRTHELRTVLRRRKVG